MKHYLSRYHAFKTVYYFFANLVQSYHWNIFGFLRNLSWYIKDLFTYNKQPAHQKFSLQLNYLYPVLIDKTDTTPVEPTYFFQDSWFAKQLFQNKPKKHVDVASNVKMLGIVSQFVPVVFVDIRPIELTLPGLTFVKGTILELPFKSNSVESLSSICVVEHIGLGRYGDPIDPHGSEKAITELRRVMKPDGHLYVTVPVDAQNRLYFNAHRAFTPEYFLSLFPDFDLKEEKYLYGTDFVNNYDKARGFGTGMYHLQKK